VVESGPAARAGLKAGDRVSAFDGTAVAAIPAGPLGALLDGEDAVVLQIESDGVPRTITIPIQTFIK
jgi:C-terminal processing protease CtpA/Prc